MKTWIVGKHPSILQWPKGFFEGKNSIGLNSINTYGVKTDRVMTGHLDNLQGYKRDKIPRKDWILVRPMFDYQPIYSSGHFIKWNRHAKPHRHEDLTPQEILTYLKRAQAVHRTGNKEIPFPNFWSVLHLAIFFAIGEGSTEIHLAGCNNEPGKKLPNSRPFLHAEYANRHTRMMMEQAPALGIMIYRHLSYESYQNNANN